jgi:Icc-related predicted phosphoesterase
MKIVATSDLHGHLPEISECDLLLIAGDVCPVWDHKEQYQMDWLRHSFSPWMKEQPAREIVWIGGNHDFVLEKARRSKIDALGGTYLEDQEFEFEGVKIWGSPYSPTFGNWAFMEDDWWLFDIWNKISEDTEILVVHGPPMGYGDLTTGFMGNPPENVGSRTLRDRIRKENMPELKVVVTGHIHPAYGSYETLDGVKVINASFVNEQYKPKNRPVEFEL